MGGDDDEEGKINSENQLANKRAKSRPVIEKKVIVDAERELSYE